MSRAGVACALFTVAAMALTACGGDSASGPPAPTPAALQIVAGDAQRGLPGDTLTTPLSVRVTDAGGEPFEGARVHWRVTDGYAGIVDSVTRSGPDGLASTRLFLGALTPSATVSVEASVDGLAPVTFSASMIDPCTYVHDFAIGQSANGSLTTPDCRLGDETPVDFFLLSVTGTRGVLLTMTTPRYSPFLFLVDSVGRPVAQTLTRPQTGLTAVRLLLPTGRFLVAANAYSAGEYGTYALSATAAPDTLGACDPAWIALGLSATERLSARCPAAGGPVQHQVLFGLRGGDSVTVTMTATGFRASVWLYVVGVGGSPVRVATATDPGQPATAGYTVAQTTLLTALLRSSTTTDTGAYTFSVR